jgi:hypothetical protein
LVSISPITLNDILFFSLVFSTKNHLLKDSHTTGA